jgi:hypothetical protein
MCAAAKEGGESFATIAQRELNDVDEGSFGTFRNGTRRGDCVERAGEFVGCCEQPHQTV